MAIGMTCAILILLWVQDEWSYDRHFENADNLYRIIENQNLSGGEASLLVPTPSALAHTLKEEYPEIIRTSRYTLTPLALKKGEDFIEETVASVDKDFLKMFSIRFVRGDINTALNDPHNIVITEEMAGKYFGNHDALGKTLQSFGYVVTITGVVKSLAHNSHIHFNFLVPTNWFTLFTGTGVNLNDWDHRDLTYLELKKGTDPKVVDQKIINIIKKHKTGSTSEIFLQNIKKIHLYSSKKYTYDVSGNGDITNVRILSLIAVFILLIACINFMNLSTAQSVARAREIGIRKLAGANKLNIISRFLGESFLIVFIAQVIALILVELLLPGYNNLIGKQLEVNYQSPELYIGIITILLVCGLLAGSYPAFYLSSLKTLDIMRGVISKNPGTAKFRKVLVVFQFSLSILLIICTLIVVKQLNYLQNKDLGFNKDNIGYFMFPTRPGDPQLESIKKELSNNPDIESVTITHFNPFTTESHVGGFNWLGKKESDDVVFYQQSVDKDYAKTFKLQLKEGRFFSSEFSTDTAAVVINETAARIMGFKNPIDEIITTPHGNKLNIIGVVKDFHFRSLHHKIEPLIMQSGVDNNFYLKMKPNKLTSTVEFVKKTFKSFHPSVPLDFKFLENDYDKLYMTEQRMGKILGYFSFLAIIISCLGLIGLSSFMIQRRTKEIGIRKVNGAKTIEIFSLLSKEYIKWVMIAIIIACPAAWYAMNKWLQNFAYITNLSWWIFVLASVFALLIAILTVSVQSYKAANRNPVEALRYDY